MNDTSTALLHRITSATLATLVGQRMEHLGEDITAPSEHRVKELCDWVEKQGINPAELAMEIMKFVYDIHSTEQICKAYIRGFAQIMWQILGDKDSNSRPPAIYYEAATACYAVMLRGFDVTPELQSEQ